MSHPLACCSAFSLFWQDRAGYAYDTPCTGANLVWTMNVQIARGLLFANHSAVAGGFGRFWRACARAPSAQSDGIMVDGSYHQHSNVPPLPPRGQLHAGSYGDALAAKTLSGEIAATCTNALWAIYGKNKDYDEALGYITAWAAAHPKDPSPYWWAGWYQRQKGAEQEDWLIVVSLSVSR